LAYDINTTSLKYSGITDLWWFFTQILISQISDQSRSLPCITWTAGPLCLIVYGSHVYCVNSFWWSRLRKHEFWFTSVYDVSIDIFKGMKDDEIKMTSVFAKLLKLVLRWLFYRPCVLRQQFSMIKFKKTWILVYQRIWRQYWHYQGW
jgi:hypothetical protein